MSRIFNALVPTKGVGQACPECETSLPAEAINIQEGVALCPGCGKLSRLSELPPAMRPTAEVLAQTPSGCSIEPTSHGAVLKATTRSLMGVIFPGCFALFWNSIVSVFLCVAVSGLYANLVGPLPDWFPVAGEEGRPMMNDQPMDLGATLFLCVFLIPFVLVGTFMAGLTLVNLFGRVRVVIDEFDSHVSTGVAFIRWKKRFDKRQFQSVSFGQSRWETNGQTHRIIILKADKTIRFGSMLREDRLEWLRAAIKETVANPHGMLNYGKHGSTLPFSPTKLS